MSDQNARLNKAASPFHLSDKNSQEGRKQKFSVVRNGQVTFGQTTDRLLTVRPNGFRTCPLKEMAKEQKPTCMTRSQPQGRIEEPRIGGDLGRGRHEPQPGVERESLVLGQPRDDQELHLLRKGSGKEVLGQTFDDESTEKKERKQCHDGKEQSDRLTKSKKLNPIVSKEKDEIGHVMY